MTKLIIDEDMLQDLLNELEVKQQNDWDGPDLSSSMSLLDAYSNGYSWALEEVYCALEEKWNALERSGVSKE